MKKHTKNNIQKNNMIKHIKKMITTIKIIKVIKIKSTITTITLLKIIKIIIDPIMIRIKVNTLIVHINKNTNFIPRTTTSITEMDTIAITIKTDIKIKMIIIELNINTKIIICIKVGIIKKTKIMNM